MRGRFFETHDSPDSPPAVVINRRLAEKYWPGEEAIGKRLKIGPRRFTEFVADSCRRRRRRASRPDLANRNWNSMCLTCRSAAHSWRLAISSCARRRSGVIAGAVRRQFGQWTRTSRFRTSARWTRCSRGDLAGTFPGPHARFVCCARARARVRRALRRDLATPVVATNARDRCAHGAGRAAARRAEARHPTGNVI